MAEVLKVLFMRGVRRLGLLLLLGCIAFALAILAIVWIVHGFIRSNFEQVTTGASLLGVIFGFLTISVVVYEISRGTGRDFVRGLRRERYEAIAAHLDDALALHGIGDGKLLTSSDQTSTRRIGNYRPEGAFAMATMAELAAFRSKWSTHIIDSEGSFWFVYDHEAPSASSLATSNSKFCDVCQPVRMGVFQFGNELRLGVFFDEQLLTRLMGPTNSAELVKRCKHYFLSSKAGLHMTRRHELLLVQRIIRKGDLLTAPFVWDGIEAEINNIATHLAIDIYNALASAQAIQPSAPSPPPHPRALELTLDSSHA